MNHCAQLTSIPTVFLAMASAAALGASAVKNNELVTAVDAKGPHHIGADFAGGRSRLGAVDARDVADDGIDDAAAARGVGGRRRRQQEVRHRHCITEAERVAAELLH